MICRQYNEKEFKILQKILELKKRFMEKNHIPNGPAYFENGAEVGFFYAPHEKAYDEGYVINDYPEYVHVRSKNGVDYQVSPFSLIHLAKFCH